MILNTDTRRTQMNNLNDIFFAPAENTGLTYEDILDDECR